MSFRTRLTSFFLLIVVVPMVAVGFLVFRLIGDSETGKADARAVGIANAAADVYENSIRAARYDAKMVAGDVGSLNGSSLRTRLLALTTSAGLARIVVTEGSRTLADVGTRTAIAPGFAAVGATPRRSAVSVGVSELTAAQYGRQLSGSGIAVVVRQGALTLGSTVPRTGNTALPRHGTVTIGGAGYRAVTQTFAGFGQSAVEVTTLSSLSASAGMAGTSRVLAGVLIAASLLLAFVFALLASRALQSQLGRFLEAARRLGSGDFSAPVPTEGSDEFAALGQEFNSMSNQLAGRLDELDRERARLRESIRRIGQTFASNLDRPALLELALQTAVDAVHADCGRLTARANPGEPLSEAARVGSLTGLERQVRAAEGAALESGGFGEADGESASIASVALGAFEPGGRTHGLITVSRASRPFDDDDREVLRSLASQAALALENVELHFQVRRQAVTDELTGLANHGRFQELLNAEVEAVRRYNHPVGLIMLDIDDFKLINDTHGHQQGDLVLGHVARVLRENSRDVDVPARYGGEEMALILPHTDLDGAYAIAERIRSAIEALRVPQLDGTGALRVSASVGVASSSEGSKSELILAADSALYAAKRHGKNRTMKAEAQTANVFGAG